jgi:hypothetical protein
MLVNNVQQHEDKSLVFTGTLTPPEVEIVVSFGINALMHLGLMHLLPSLESTPVEATSH